jgi:tRNA(Ile)-lysidine synthase
VLAEFKKHIENKFPELLQEKFFLACSGGVDSVVLGHLCAQCDMDFALAHCNFKLRGKASDDDEKFVKKLSESLNREFYVTQFDTNSYVEEHKVSVQMAARELRYDWFDQLMLKTNVKRLVTAHHADDDLETFIINLSRGTGIKGLAGIPAKTDKIARPLLSFSREQIVTFAETANIQWREDASNEDAKYLRNKIRHEIVPLLKELHPTFLENFKTTQDNLEQTAGLNEKYLAQLKERLFEEKGDVIRIKIESLIQLNPLNPYLYGLFHDFGFTAWKDISKLLTSLSGKEVQSKTHRLVKDRDFLLLTRLSEKNEHSFLLHENVNSIKTPIHLTISDAALISQTGTNTLYVDKETLKYPLVLRKWEKGDYFYPLGMRGKKKISKFFKDEKVDIIAKEKQWLLCSENQVVWVVGMRCDERFKVTGQTKKILKIVLNK